MPYVRILLATLLVAVLAACGGPSAPRNPTVAGVTPAVAPRGDAIKVTGTDFGTSGTLTIGGVEATVTSWTATKIEATVAGGTPDGWQDVVVSTAHGADDFSPFFVGVEYSGTASGLQVFLDGLDRGTAVLLQAQTYDLSATTEVLTVDNHGLFGRGEAQTTLKLSLTNGAVVLSDWGESVTIADLAIESDSIGFFHGTVVETLSTLGLNSFSASQLDEATVERTISLPSAPAVADAWTTAAFPDLGLAADALPTFGALSARTPAPRVVTVDALAYAPEIALAPAGLSTPKMTLRNVSYSEVAGGGYFGIPVMIIPSLDLTLTDVTIDADTSALVLLSSRNLTLERVDATAVEVVLGSFEGTLTVRDSTVESATAVGLWAEAGLNVSGSTVRAADGDIDVIGAAAAIVGSGTLPTGGSIEIAGSTFEALDGNLADGSDKGELTFLTQFAPIGLTDNVRIRSHGDMAIVTQQSLIGEGGITLAGNGDVRAGVFKSEDAVHFRPATIDIVAVSGGSLADTVRLDDNIITATAEVAVVSGGGTPGFLAARHNTLTAGDGENTGVLQLAAGATGQLKLEDNVLSADGGIVVGAPDLLGTTAVLTDNVFSAIGDAAPQVITQLIGGSCELSGNTFEARDIGANDAASVNLACEGANPLEDTFRVEGNTMKAGGDGTSVLLTSFASGALTMSSNQVAVESGFLIAADDVDGVVSSNIIQLLGGFFGVIGNAASDMTIDANVVTLQDAANYGLLMGGSGVATVTGNNFTVTGTPAATATAFGIGTNSAPIEVTASGNTFTNFSRALYISDASGTAWGITAAIHNNVFDFVINAAPKVATLFNVKSSIDARNNQWGTNTSSATVAGYVTLTGDTAVQGGSIQLNPITQP